MHLGFNAATYYLLLPIASDFYFELKLKYVLPLITLIFANCVTVVRLKIYRSRLCRATLSGAKGRMIRRVQPI